MAGKMPAFMLKNMKAKGKAKPGDPAVAGAPPPFPPKKKKAKGK